MKKNLFFLGCLLTTGSVIFYLSSHKTKDLSQSQKNAKDQSAEISSDNRRPSNHMQKELNVTNIQPSNKKVSLSVSVNESNELNESNLMSDGTALNGDVIEALLKSEGFNESIHKFRANSPTEKSSQNTDRYGNLLKSHKAVISGDAVINSVACSESICIASLRCTKQLDSSKFVMDIPDSQDAAFFSAIHHTTRGPYGDEIRVVFSVDSQVSSINSSLH